MRTDFEKIKVDIMKQEIEIKNEKFRLLGVKDVEEFKIKNLHIIRVDLWLSKEATQTPYFANTLYVIQNKEKYECFLKDIAEVGAVYSIFSMYQGKTTEEQKIMKNIFLDACCRYQLDTRAYAEKVGMTERGQCGSKSIVTEVKSTFRADGIGDTQKRINEYQLSDIPMRPIPFRNKVFCDNNFEDIKMLFIRLMTEDIDDLKSEKMSQDVISLINTYKEKYGNDLAKIESIQDEYSEQKEWRKVYESIDNEINLFKYGIDHYIDDESKIKTIMSALISVKETIRKENEYNDSRANGVKGEQEVDYALKWLDKSYISIPKTSDDGHGNRCIIITNPEFIDESQEYDHIVVGRQGIFLIETKNYAGKLIIDKYGNWIRIRQDGTEEGERNPIQQIKRHEKMLRSFIPEDIDIIDIICMAHPKMIIEGIENCAIPLIKSDMLVEYIENYDNGKALLDSQVRECVDCIKRHTK